MPHGNSWAGVLPEPERAQRSRTLRHPAPNRTGTRADTLEQGTAQQGELFERPIDDRAPFGERARARVLEEEKGKRFTGRTLT